MRLLILFLHLNNILLGKKPLHMGKKVIQFPNGTPNITKLKDFTLRSTKMVHL